MEQIEYNPTHIARWIYFNFIKKSGEAHIATQTTFERRQSKGGNIVAFDPVDAPSEVINVSISNLQLSTFLENF